MIYTYACVCINLLVIGVIARHGGQAVSTAGLTRVLEGICAQRPTHLPTEYEYSLAMDA